MAKDTFTGPLIALGGLAGGPSGGSPREYSDEIGPSIFWAGMAIPATGANANKDRMGPGSVPSVYLAAPIRTVNSILAAGGAAAALTVAGPAAAGTPLVNISTYAVGRAPGTPVTVSGVATTGVAIDSGLDTATFATSGGSPSGGLLTLAAPSVAANTWRYQVGQWICMLNGGPSGSARMTQIVGIGSGTLSVNPPPAAAVTGQIALTNRYNPNAYGASQTAPATISSMAAAGSARIVIPELGNSRGIGISGVAGGTGGTFNVVGVGTFGGIQNEVITVGAGAVTGWSKKTYDMVISVTPNFTDAGHNYTVIVSDFIGLPMSVMDASSIVAVSLGGAAAVAGTNFTVIPADLTYPPTATTGDPRGGIQGTANGPGATPGTPMGAFDGTKVLTIDQRLNPLQVALASSVNPGSLLGLWTV